MLPFAPVDWSFLSPVTYIRNFELHGHGYLGDDTMNNLMNGRSRTDIKAYAGASLLVRLSNFAWIPFDTRVGFKYMQGLTPESKSYGNLVITADI